MAIGLACSKQFNIKTDSLLQILQSNRDDSFRVNALNALATNLSKENPDSALALSTAALSLSQKKNYKAGEAHSYFSLGQEYVAKSNDAIAQANFEQALKLYELIR